MCVFVCVFVCVCVCASESERERERRQTKYLLVTQSFTHSVSHSAYFWSLSSPANEFQKPTFEVFIKQITVSTNFPV